MCSECHSFKVLRFGSLLSCYEQNKIDPWIDFVPAFSRVRRVGMGSRMTKYEGGAMRFR